MKNMRTFCELQQFVKVLAISIAFGATSIAIGAATQTPGADSPLPANFNRLAGPHAVEAAPVEVLDGHPDHVRIRMTNPPLQFGTTMLDGREFTTIRMDGEGSITEPGMPDVPRITRLLIIGNTGRAELAIRNTDFTSQTLLHPAAPMQADPAEQPGELIAFNHEIYNTDGWYPPQPAEISEPTVLRDVRFVVLTLYPVQVNPVTGEMRRIEAIEVEVMNTGGSGVNEIRHRPNSITPGFKQLYSAFENFRGSALDELPVVPGKQLIISNDAAEITPLVANLVNWRRKKGIDASHVTTAAIGGNTSTAIRNYIQTQYDLSNGELEFVTLIGDPDAGSPYNLVSGGSELDNYFGSLSGGENPDPVPDIAVGRLPARSGNELNAMIAKTIGYESDPFVSDTTWFGRAWCAAHTNYVPSNVSTKEYTRQIMLQHGMHTVHFNEFSGGMNTSILQTRINEGVCVFNDRLSWIGEFSSSQLDGLSNGRKLPFVMVITCGTGTFSGGTALSEEWVRRGTASNPVGAIGCVGLSGLGTHVPYNNIVDAGVMYGLYVQRIYEQGIALIAGKLQLYKNYWEFGHQNDVRNFSYWANLMGDPAVPVWLSVPRSVSVSRPASVHVGTNTVEVSVSRGGQPVAGALVGMLKGTETFARGYTAANGRINLPVNVPTTGYVYLTITGAGIDSYVDSIQVYTPTQSLAYFNHTVDDDNSGGTTGDGNGIINPGETVDLSIRLRNAGSSQTASGISAVLSSEAPGIQVISGSSSYPNITVGSNAAPNTPFRIIVNQVFDGEPVTLLLTATSSAGVQVIRLNLTPAAADVAFLSSAFLDGNSRLDPGDTGNFTVTMQNDGSRPLASASALLRSLDSRITVNDSVGAYGNVNPGANATNSSNTFNITASSLTNGGYRATLQLVVSDANGFRDSVNFQQTIGVAVTTTPTGPDGYGYFAYDNTETQPAGTAAQYAWVELAPGLGGPGTSLGFTDGSEDADQVTTRTLPFSFQFYGQNYNQISICSNGWLALGDYPIDDFRNYRMGTPLGPPNQVAAYWDDLVVTGVTAGGVYTYSDPANHRYLVEWRTRTLWTSQPQTFQIILYDPTFYPTPTGDGKILVQYQDVNPNANHDNSSTDNDWASVGIQNADHSIGLDYCYWNTYPPTAAPLTDGLAVMYTTDYSGFLSPPLTLVSPNGGETWYRNTAAAIAWVGGTLTDPVRLELSRSGAGGPWETLAASTPNDGSQTVSITGAVAATCRVRITNVNDPGETDMSDADFTLAGLTVLSPNGGETWYRDSVATTTWIGGNPAAMMTIELSRSGSGGPWEMWATSVPNTGAYAAVMSGTASETCRIRVTSQDDPTDTDISNGDFAIAAIQLVLGENFDSGAPGWTHTSAGGQWVDDWHISSERAHSGANSYKCGSTGTGSYSNLLDAWLLSPVVNTLPAGATMSIVHQIHAERSGTYPDSAYDGGRIEIAVNGGAFQTLVPAGGYTHTFRNTAGGSNPYTGPLPGAACFSDSIGVWTTLQFDLAPFADDNVQFRFRFCSDANTTREGWYLDDFVIFAPFVPGEPTIPQAVTVAVSGADLVLRWADDGNLYYRVYSATSAEGPYDRFEGSTTATEMTIIGGAASVRKFFLVTGWDGN